MMRKGCLPLKTKIMIILLNDRQRAGYTDRELGNMLGLSRSHANLILNRYCSRWVERRLEWHPSDCTFQKVNVYRARAEVMP